MEMEVARSIAGRERNRSWIIRLERALLLVEFPNKNLVESKIDVQNEAAREIGLDHVGVGPIMSAEGKAAGRSIGCTRGPELSVVFFDIARRAESAVGQDGQHGDRAAEIICHQQKFSRWVNAEVGGAGPARA